MIRSTQALLHAVSFASVKKRAGRFGVVLLGALLTSSALVIGGAGPAAAAVPDRWGFAYMNVPVPPGPGTLIDTTRQWGSWKTFAPGAWATVDPIGVGRYRVHFPFTASVGGVAHVTAVAPDARHCQVFNNFASGTDQLVDVQCYKFPGIPDWSRFTVVYSTSSGAVPIPGLYAYVYANILGGTINSFNSSGVPNSVVHIGVGQYRVTLPNMSGGSLDGDVQVTAQHPNSPRRCKVGSWTPAGGPSLSVHVLCFDGTSALADSWFNLTFQAKRAIFGALAPPFNLAYLWSLGLGTGADYNSMGCVNSVIPAGVGQYLVLFPCVGVKETHVQVTAYGFSRDWCNLQEVWQFNGTTVVVRNVICFNGAGVQAPNEYMVTYSSRA